MKTKVNVGAIYEHYKGKQYKVLAIAHNEADLDQGLLDHRQVVYQALYDDAALGKQPVFIRPLSAFAEEIELDGAKRLRFEKVLAS